MIYCDNIEDMATICATLERQSVVFNAVKNGDKWEISITGH